MYVMPLLTARTVYNKHVMYVMPSLTARQHL